MFFGIHLLLFVQMGGICNHNDNELLALMKQGDRGAMKVFYDRYVGYMSAIAGRYIASATDRKDVLQESFIKIFSSVGRFEPLREGSLRVWIARITVNESLRFLKKNSVLDFIDNDALLPDVADEPDVDVVSDDLLNDMLLSMPTGYRMVFNLYVFEQKSHKEIAEMLGISESTSASQFSRAKSLLAKKIKEYKLAHENE